MHESVLLKESIEALNIKSDGKYVDGTLGYAGHSSEILKRLDDGVLYAFDQDAEAIKHSEKVLSKISDNYKIFHDNFVNIKNYIDEDIDGFLFDLGVSSPQLDNSDRGFSFHKDAKLDMRMDRDKSFSAWNVVNEYSMEDLTRIFYEYGEEKHSKSIARAILGARPINSTLELVELIKDNVPISYRKKGHPARKVFQAIRIEVNNELDILVNTMLDSFNLLNKGGRICVITFHSLEDRIIKKVFKGLCSDDEAAKGLPIVPDSMKAKARSIMNIGVTDEEIDSNKRSRSARLRVIERI